MTRTKATIATLVISMLTVGGLAQARPSGGGAPSLSLTAFDGGRKVKATGWYSPERNHLCPAGGKTVMLLGDATGASTTNSQGFYNLQSDRVPRGTYTVHTHVNGVMGGPYGDIVICQDVDSPNKTVAVK